MKKSNDMFANIASIDQNFATRGLEKPPVMPTPDISMEMSENFKDFSSECPKKMDTKKELYEEVEKQKKYYEPFLKKNSPEIKSFRHKYVLKNFERKGEDETEWKKITLPYYYGPVGVYTDYYRTEFEVTEEMLNEESIYICFKAADYIASVMVNGEFIGRHEGFFAPFDFNIKKYVKKGKNSVLVKLQNDVSILKGGDKIYAATGMGFNEPEQGWHHCPAGMGLFQEVYIETRRNVYLQNLFVRHTGDCKHMELWAEVISTEQKEKEVDFKFSVYGENFKETVIENEIYNPSTNRAIGVGDSLGEAMTRKDNLLGVPVHMKLGHGINYFKIPFTINNAKIWDLNTPYLYDAQLTVISDKKEKDIQSVVFGVRTFKIDTENIPKGQMFLNGRKIRLRGTNTMGHEQQDVYKNDFDQLITDILLAKICHMNFFRLTQRPVQDEVYQYCDKLGIMTQTDFPLFANIRKNQFCECLREVEEMEKLIRPHACNIMVSYINEPLPNAANAPHRNLTRKEMEKFFDCADVLIKMNNPDRITKHVDGDYDPPSKTLPDNHCYTMWYNGNGIDIGTLNKGEWMPIKKDWCFGCGEFGSEGIDTVEIMKKYYPKSWINTKDRESEWTPNEIPGAQTGNFHYFFYETPKTMQQWSDDSRKYQAEATRWQTECYRRNPLMVSFAIHLFIDAFPSNWMKTIMDYDRNPKPAYFAYRNAIKPVEVSIRSDFTKVFENTIFKVQPFVCNDTDKELKDCTLYYQIDGTGLGGSIKAKIDACMPNNQGNIIIKAPKVDKRTLYTLRIMLKNKDGEILDWTTNTFEVFPSIKPENKNICAYGDTAKKLVKDMNYTCNIKSDIILLSDYSDYENNKTEIDKKLNSGAKVIMMRLSNGEYNIAGNKITAKFSAMLPLHFASRDTGSKVVEGFKSDDFKYWYNEENERISPIVMDSLECEGFSPILTVGNVNTKGQWDKADAVCEKHIGKGKLVLCQLDVSDRVNINPIAREFTKRLLSL